MRKYAVALEPATVARMREEARRVAAQEGRDLTWVGLLREVVEGFLAGRATNVVSAPTGNSL